MGVSLPFIMMMTLQQVLRAFEVDFHSPDLSKVDAMGFQDHNIRVLKKHRVFEWHSGIASNLSDLFDVIS